MGFKKLSPSRANLGRRWTLPSSLRLRRGRAGDGQPKAQQERRPTDLLSDESDRTAVDGSHRAAEEAAPPAPEAMRPMGQMGQMAARDGGGHRDVGGSDDHEEEEDSFMRSDTCVSSSSRSKYRRSASRQEGSTSSSSSRHPARRPRGPHDDRSCSSRRSASARRPRQPPPPRIINRQEELLEAAAQSILRQHSPARQRHRPSSSDSRSQSTSSHRRQASREHRPRSQSTSTSRSKPRKASRTKHSSRSSSHRTTSRAKSRSNSTSHRHPKPRSKSRSHSSAKCRDDRSKSRPRPPSGTNIDYQGRCPSHSYVILQRYSRKKRAWRTLLDACPVCAAAADDEHAVGAGEKEGGEMEEGSCSVGGAASLQSVSTPQAHRSATLGPVESMEPNGTKQHRSRSNPRTRKLQHEPPRRSRSHSHTRRPSVEAILAHSNEMRRSNSADTDVNVTYYTELGRRLQCGRSGGGGFVVGNGMASMSASTVAASSSGSTVPGMPPKVDSYEHGSVASSASAASVRSTAQCAGNHRQSLRRMEIDQARHVRFVDDMTTASSSTASAAGTVSGRWDGMRRLLNGSAVSYHY